VLIFAGTWPALKRQGKGNGWRELLRLPSVKRFTKPYTNNWRKIMANRIYSFIGLAQKAGKLVSGEFACEKAVKQGKAYLVIVAEDASDNTKKMFKDMCEFRKVPIRFFGAKSLLGSCIGKGTRAVIVILGDGFSNKLMKLMDDTDAQNGGE